MNIKPQSNKPRIIRIVSVFLLIIGVTGIFALSYLKPNWFFSPAISGSDANVYILSKFDLFNPVYTYIQNGSEVYRSCPENQQFAFGKISLERTTIINWKIRDSKGTDASCKDLGRVQNSFLKDVFSDKIKSDQQYINNSPFNQPFDSLYNNYFPETDIKDKNRTLDKFSSLQLGMTLQAVDDQIGYSDRALSSPESEKEGLFDLEYKIKDDKVNFVALSFDKPPISSSDGKLVKIIAVNKDGTKTRLK